MARSKSSPSSALVEPVGADLVALAQAHALDATVFPHPSLPFVLGPDFSPSLWVARAQRGGPVVGFVATGLNAKTHTLEISGLAVELPHRRTGLGRALVRAVIRSARRRDLASVSLHVSTGNIAALALYEALGFRRERRITAFYKSGRFPDGGDAWLMMRDIE